jgi:DNA polymerase-3 subunit alpha
MLDLHRHDEFSIFDGFGKAEEVVNYAIELGYTAIGISNHGNTSGLIKYYLACKDKNIKPILGVEAYFQPSFDIDKSRYHLCLFAKNTKGYENINHLMYIAEQQKYYKPIITFKDLEQYHEGIICTSACVAGFISQMLLSNKKNIAIKAAKKFKKIFEDDFYIEIQPYKIDNENTQQKVNIELIKLAKELNIKTILTSDSHYIKKEDFDTYLIMHQIAKSGYDIEKVSETYGERYMPKPMELMDRFIKMHQRDFSNIRAMAEEMYKNLEEIEHKVDKVENIFNLPLLLPSMHDGNSYKKLVEQVKIGLKNRNKYKKEYIDRCKQELDVIKGHGFADYFLIVSDYVNWAKSQGIAVGPGRGSVCNSLVAYALGITEVDSLKFNLDFRRFLRYDKTTIPDIDLDFETSRRDEVIDYIVNKYKGNTAQICSYGLYKVDNLVNDLVKVCGVEDETEKTNIKKLINNYIDENKDLIVDGLINDKNYNSINKKYNNILKHFVKMFKKVRYIGTHAAGVAVVGDDIEKYTALRYDKKVNKIYTAYDLADLEKINVVKFDILGLNTMEQINELKKLTKVNPDLDEILEDTRIYEEFRKGNTAGIFQFEKDVAKEILANIQCDCFEDLVAASAMNRPGPLSLKQPEQYAKNKFNQDEISKELYYRYTKETYGTIIYQEQIQQICINIGKMSWADADKVMKMLKGGAMTKEGLERFKKNKDELQAKFIKGAVENGYTKEKAKKLFDMMVVYSFNKGHAVGYTLISILEMWFKIYYPLHFWYIKNKYADAEKDRYLYTIEAAKNGILFFLPHVNYSADFSLRKIDDDYVIQEGLNSIKGVGEKAALFIEEERKKNGPFKSEEEFIKRVKVKKSPVNKGVIDKLRQNGALEFNKKVYISRVTQYNSTLYMKSQK